MGYGKSPGFQRNRNAINVNAVVAYYASYLTLGLPAG